MLIDEIIELYEDENADRKFNYKHELDFTDKICVLEQHLNDKEYESFMEDILNSDYQIYFEPIYDEYDYTKINIGFYDDRDYRYCIEFDTVPDWSGYCECEINDKGYDARYKCCGICCDWYIPTFKITKIETIGHSQFDGLQRDLWKYKDKFYNVTQKEKEQQEKLIAINSLKRQKEEIERKLKELEEMI